MKNRLKKIYRAIFPSYSDELEKAIGDCRTLLDVGCGSNSPIAPFSSQLHSVGVDGFQPSIDKSKVLGIHNDYMLMNVLDIDKTLPDNSFDCVLASDLIEHFEKDEGVKLLEAMERIASKRVIVFTPNGFLPQGEYDSNPFQVHKSGWSAGEMKSRGYRALGINGWKPLRVEEADFRFRPRLLWMLISDITQIFVRSAPEKAFHILCIKDISTE